MTFGDFDFGEGIGIEGTTVPIGQFVVVVMLGVFERFAEGVEARQSAVSGEFQGCSVWIAYEMAISHSVSRAK